MEKETCATLLKLSSVAICGAAVAGTTAMTFGAVALVTGGAHVADLFNT